MTGSRSPFSLYGEKAIEFVEDGMIVGVGTGSTVAYFIDALAKIKHRIKARANYLIATQFLKGFRYICPNFVKTFKVSHEFRIVPLRMDFRKISKKHTHWFLTR